jgi:hypothetical protein
MIGSRIRFRSHAYFVHAIFVKTLALSAADAGQVSQVKHRDEKEV